MAPFDDRFVALAGATVAVLVVAAGLLHRPTRCRWWASFARSEEEGRRRRVAVEVLEEAQARGFARARGLRVYSRGAVGGWVVEARGAEPIVCSTDRQALDEIGRRLALPPGGGR